MIVYKWCAREDLHLQGFLILSQAGLLFPLDHVRVKWYVYAMKLKVVYHRFPRKNRTVYDLGDCSGKVVRIDRRQGQKEMLDTAIHEGLHAAFPHLKEPQIRRAAAIIAQIPWKLGFRLRKKNGAPGKTKRGS